MKKLLLLSAFVLYVITSSAQTISLQQVGEGFVKPTEITNAGDSRLFVVEQQGLVRILNEDGSINELPFLDISALVAYDGNEQGFSGMVFHPDYAENGIFYVSYTDISGNNAIVRYHTGSNPDVADAGSAEIILNIQQPTAVHNSGCMRFGSDGYLYIAIGDGGVWEDPDNYAQNLNSLLGKILRIDVDNGIPYSIPSDNPYVGTGGAEEIWAYGLRNPWKFSFDSSGNIWIADVGQQLIEEINKASGAAAGLNYGWRCYEGNEEFNTEDCVGQVTWPAASYSHSVNGSFFGCSIIGGYVYQGSLYSSLHGLYFFADFCNNKIGMLNSSFEVSWSEVFSNNSFTTFGLDNEGELYIAGNASGKIYRVTDGTNSAHTFKNSHFVVYPNPADDVITVKSSGDLNPESAKLFDISGKLLLKKQFTAGGEYTIPVSGLPSGLYILQVTAADGTVYNHKLSVK